MNELKHICTIAQSLGRRKDIVQGAGGNISLKQDDDALYIKPSGRTLSDMHEPADMVRIDMAPFRSLYTQVKPDAAAAAALLVPNQGLRPSMETAFHTLMGRVVIHTHPVYVNAITCCVAGQHIARSVFPEATWVPYATPGHDLALEVRDVPGRQTNVYLFQNHGLTVVADTIDECLTLHDDVIRRAEEYTGRIEWPATLWRRREHAIVADNPVLRRYAADANAAETLLRNHPFPDSFVFTDGAPVGTFDDIIVSGAPVGLALGVGMCYRTDAKKAADYNDILTASHLVRTLADTLGGARYLAPQHLAALRMSDAERYRRDG